MERISEILRNAPQGTELYSMNFGEVNLTRVDENGDIITYSKNDGRIVVFDCDGRTNAYGEVMLYPERGYFSWNFWQKYLFNDGDIITDGEHIGRFSESISAYSRVSVAEETYTLTTDDETIVIDDIRDYRYYDGDESVDVKISYNDAKRYFDNVDYECLEKPMADFVRKECMAAIRYLIKNRKFPKTAGCDKEHEPQESIKPGDYVMLKANGAYFPNCRKVNPVRSLVFKNDGPWVVVEMLNQYEAPEVYEYKIDDVEVVYSPEKTIAYDLLCGDIIKWDEDGEKKFAIVGSINEDTGRVLFKFLYTEGVKGGNLRVGGDSCSVYLAERHVRYASEEDMAKLRRALDIRAFSLSVFDNPIAELIKLDDN